MYREHVYRKLIKSLPEICNETYCGLDGVVGDSTADHEGWLSSSAASMFFLRAKPRRQYIETAL